MLQKFVLLILIIMVTACASSPKKQQAEIDPIKCPEERTQMCTREYLPVCATRDTGIRCITAPCPSSEQITLGNACTACADPKVIEYRAGACTKTNEKH